MLDFQVANHKTHVVNTGFGVRHGYSNHSLAKSDFRQVEAYSCVLDPWIYFVGQPIHWEAKRPRLAHGRPFTPE